MTSHTDNIGIPTPTPILDVPFGMRIDEDFKLWMDAKAAEFKSSEAIFGDYVHTGMFKSISSEELQITTVTPHLIQLKPVSDSIPFSGVDFLYNSLSSSQHRFVPAMVKKMCSTYSMIYPAIKSYGLDLNFELDPFNLNECKIEVEGFKLEEILKMNGYNEGATNLSLQGLTTSGRVMAILVGLIALAPRLGTYVLVDKVVAPENEIIASLHAQQMKLTADDFQKIPSLIETDEVTNSERKISLLELYKFNGIPTTESVIGGDDNFFQYRIVGPDMPAFSNINGHIPKDDWEAYPHVVEVLSDFSVLPVIQEQVKTHLLEEQIIYGSVSQDSERGAISRTSQKAYINTDVPLATMHSNYMKHINTNKFSDSSYFELINSSGMRPSDFMNPNANFKITTMANYQVNSTVDAYRVVHFPGGNEYKEAYKTVINDDLSVLRSVYSAIREGIFVKLSLFPLLSYSEMFSGLTAETKQPQGMTGEALRKLIENWNISLARGFNLEGLSHRMTQELMADYLNYQDHPETDFSFTPSGFAANLLGLKCSLLLSPNAYSYSKHTKATRIATFLKSYFKNHYHSFIGDVWAYSGNRGVTYSLEGNKSRLRNGQTAFRVLNANYETPRGGEQGYTLMQRVRKFLLDPKYRCDYEHVIENTRYRVKGRKFRMPGRCRHPGNSFGLHNDNLFFQKISTEFEEITRAFEEQVYKHEKGSGEANAGKTLLFHNRQAVKDYWSQFSEYFAWVYCPIMLCAAKNPLLISDVYDMGDRWSDVKGIIETQNPRNNKFVEGAAYTQAKPQLFPMSGSTLSQFGPVTPKEGLLLFVAAYAQGSTWRGGLMDASILIDHSLYNSLYNIDRINVVTVFRNALYEAQRLLEVKALCGELISGTLLSDDPVRAIIKELNGSGKITAMGANYLYKSLSRNIRGLVSARLGSTPEENHVHEDLRVFFPSACVINSDLRERDVQPQNHSRVREYVRQNYKLLYEMVFGRDQGMIQFAVGVTVSMDPYDELTWNTVHTYSNMYIVMDPSTMHDIDSNAGHVFVTYRGQLMYYDEEGEQVVEAFSVQSISMLIAYIDTNFGPRCKGTFIIDKTRSYSKKVLNFMEEGVFDERAFTALDTSSIMVLNPTILKRDEITRLAIQERSKFEQLFSKNLRTIFNVTTVNTTLQNNQIMQTDLRKPFLPNDPWSPTLFSGPMSTPVPHSVYSEPRLKDFFPRLEASDEFDSPVVRNSRGEELSAYGTYPFGLRTLQTVYATPPSILPILKMVELSIT